MPNDNNKRKKPAAEQSQTLIIPKISPEMLEEARRAAQAGTEPNLPEAQAVPVEQAAPQPAARPAQPAAPKPPQPARRRKSLREEQTELDQRIHDNHLWLNNPVIMRGLGLAPIVVAAVDADNALMLCAAAILLLTTTRVLAVALCHLSGNRFRPVLYSYSAALLYIPAYILLYRLFGANLSVLGIYLPILVVEPAIVKRMENPTLESLPEALRRGINNTLGVCIATMGVGCLRELLAAGTVFAVPVFHISLLPIAGQPAGGFILVGVVAAVWTGIANSYTFYKQEELKNRYVNRNR